MDRRTSSRKSAVLDGEIARVDEAVCRSSNEKTMRKKLLFEQIVALDSEGIVCKRKD